MADANAMNNIKNRKRVPKNQIKKPAFGAPKKILAKGFGLNKDAQKWINKDKNTAENALKIGEESTSKQVNKIYRFNKANPYLTFVSVKEEELPDALDAYIVTLKESDVEEISTMRKLKTSIPFSMLKQFFRDAKLSEKLTPHWEYFKNEESVHKKIMGMREILNRRHVEPITQEEGYVRERFNVQQYPPSSVISNKNPPAIKQTKYDKNQLSKMNVIDVRKIAKDEGITAADADKTSLISKLVSIPENTLPAAPNKPYKSDIIPACESEYRNAPWMKHFTTDKIISIIGRPDKVDNMFLTGSAIGDGWSQVNTKWYKHVCENGRDFEPEAFGYLTANSKIINETQEMYEKSLTYNQHKSPQPIGITRVHNKTSMTQKYVDQDLHVKSDQPVPENVAEQHIAPTENIIEQTDEDLAPGLITYLRAMLAGYGYNCNKCNSSIQHPQLKSINNKQQVLFCGEKCFKDYPFTNKK